MLKMRELLEVAKASKSFPGLSDKDIWGACLKYKDRPDSDIDAGIKRINEADVKKTLLKQEAIARAKNIHNDHRK